MIQSIERHSDSVHSNPIGSNFPVQTNVGKESKVYYMQEVGIITLKSN